MTHSIDCVWYRRFKVNTCLNSKSYFCRLLFGIFIGMILAIISNVWWAIYTRYTVYDHILTFYDYHNHTKNSFTFHIYMSKWKFNGININLINNKWSEKKKTLLNSTDDHFFSITCSVKCHTHRFDSQTTKYAQSKHPKNSKSNTIFIFFALRINKKLTFG